MSEHFGQIKRPLDCFFPELRFKSKFDVEVAFTDGGQLEEVAGYNDLKKKLSFIQSGNSKDEPEYHRMVSTTSAVNSQYAPVCRTDPHLTWKLVDLWSAGVHSTNGQPTLIYNEHLCSIPPVTSFLVLTNLLSKDFGCLNSEANASK